MRDGLAQRKIAIATPENNRSPIVSFYIRKPAAEATRMMDAERVRVSFQDVAPQGAPSPQMRARVAIAFFNNEPDIDRMLTAAEKLIA